MQRHPDGPVTATRERGPRDRVAEELAEVLGDLLGSEQLTERPLVAGLKRLLPPPALIAIQRVVRVPVKAVAQHVDHLVVVAERPCRQALALLAKELAEHVIDRVIPRRHRQPHRIRRA
jgi:hypothetical protein